jgi:uncharacterized protein (TIGR02145 family)
MCGSVLYDPVTEVCVGGTIHRKCGSVLYPVSTKFCAAGIIYDKCGESVFNPATEGCSGGTVLPKCGNTLYDPAVKFCLGNSIYDKCGNAEFNPGTQFCVGNSVHDKCGGEEYDPDTQLCVGGLVYNGCGSLFYDVSTQFCAADVIYDKCGGKIFNPGTEFCVGSNVYAKCDGAEFNPAEERCSAGEVKKYGTFTDSRDGKIYKWVEIGAQTWMAENLNFNLSNSACTVYNPGNLACESWCYSSNDLNCDKYGRLYAKAVVKTVCPAGWHLSSREEWTALVDYAGGESTAGTKLKSTTDWKNGTDDYGFNALPGGNASRIVDSDSFGFLSSTQWWALSADDNRGYYWIFYDNSSGVTEAVESNRNIMGFNYVRCIKD